MHLHRKLCSNHGLSCQCKSAVSINRCITVCIHISFYLVSIFTERYLSVASLKQTIFTNANVVWFFINCLDQRLTLHQKNKIFLFIYLQMTQVHKTWNSPLRMNKQGSNNYVQVSKRCQKLKHSFTFFILNFKGNCK